MGIPICILKKEGICINCLWIEKFSDEKNSLLQKIGRLETGMALSDPVMEIVEEEFQIRSFEELIAKFDPCVYLYLDFTSNIIGCSRYREAEHFMLEAKIQYGMQAERIPLYRPNGFLEQIEQWMAMLHQGKKLALSTSDRRDWFYGEMVQKDCRFRSQLEHLLACAYDQKVLNAFLQEFDEGMFLIRRILHRYSLYREKKIHFAILRDEKNGQLRPLENTGYLKIAKKNKEEICEFGNRILEAMKCTPLQHNELLYWNCMMDVSGAELFESKEFISVFHRAQSLYERGMELFWKQAAPMIHSLFQIRRYFEKEDGFLFLSNCELWELLDQKQYLERFIETCNTKLNKRYEVHRVNITGSEEEQHRKKPKRERFQGKEDAIIQEKNENIIENTMKMETIMRKYHIEIVRNDMANQTEDIYEFLSRNR